MCLAARPPLARIAHIDLAVRGGRRSRARSLARELEVNPRTIERDLQFLRDRLGAPLAFDVARKGYAYTDNSFRLPFQQLTEGELLALFLAERLLQEYRHRPYAEELSRAFKKITIALPDTVSIDLSHLAEAYAFRPRTVDPGNAEQFGRLNRAIREGRQIELTYWSASHDETTCRLVDPYHLASVGGDWFLVGYCHLREEVRMFAPGRIRGLRETGVRIERPPDFRIAEYLDAGFGAVRGEGPPRLVRLRFRPAIARMRACTEHGVAVHWLTTAGRHTASLVATAGQVQRRLRQLVCPKRSATSKTQITRPSVFSQPSGTAPGRPQMETASAGGLCHHRELSKSDKMRTHQVLRG